MKMKKILMIISVGSLSLYSCTDFLTEENPNTITDQAFWKTENDFTKGLMATYNTLESSYVLGGSGSTAGHASDDITIPSPWNSDNIQLSDYTVTTVNSFVVNEWQQLYTGIFRANQVLEKIANADLSESFKTEIEAETRFLRGLYYFWLASNYNNGEVIIHTSVPKTMEEYYKSISSRKEVYTLIFDDLEFAQANLPKTWSDDNLGRATWGAATAIKGQVYLYEKMYAEAKLEFKKIIDSKLYRLTPDISWNFDLEHEYNSESIFEVNFSDAVKPGESSNNATTRAVACAPQEAGGNRAIEPAYNFIQLCKSDPIDPANPINAGQQYSQRALATICFKGDGQVFYKRPTEAFPFIVNQEGHIKKFQNWKWPAEPNTSRSGINERVVRLADVFLMYAETILKTSGEVSEAIEYVNMVRERSGVLKLNIADYDADALMTHLMRIERPLELAYEGHMIRWQDIKRWGIVTELLQELSQINYRLLPNELREATAADLLDPGAVIRKQFVEAFENYNPADDDFFPIPNQEIITNAGIFGK